MNNTCQCGCCEEFGACAAWAASPQGPCGKPAHDESHRYHPFITESAYNRARERDGLPTVDFRAFASAVVA